MLRQFSLTVLLGLFPALGWQVAAAFPQQDNSVDWVQVAPVSPKTLTRGGPVQIVVKVEYNLSTLDSAVLRIELGWSGTGCDSSEFQFLHSTSEVEIPIERGKHTIDTPITWLGDTGESPNYCILGSGYVGFIPRLFAEENGRITRVLNKLSVMGCIPVYDAGSRTIREPVTISASANPAEVSLGGASTITVVVRAPNGSPVSNARVGIMAPGSFGNDNIGKVIGSTDNQGHYATNWKLPASGNYSSNLYVNACAFKDGFQGAQQRLKVTLRQNGAASQQHAATGNDVQARVEPIATIETTDGSITCTLFPDKAPIAVSNFIGLATGTKEWKDPKTGKMMKGVPLYNGTIFHRVIPNFMIQGGDPTGNGLGNPGYTFKDEVSSDLTFDVPGRLAMANSGPNTNGSQFFITEAPTPYLNGHHTIFGQCDNIDVVKKIARLAADPRNGRPYDPPKIIQIKIVK